MLTRFLFLMSLSKITDETLQNLTEPPVLNAPSFYKLMKDVVKFPW